MGPLWVPLGDALDKLDKTEGVNSGGLGTSVYNEEIYNALYIYRFEIMILLRVNAKSLLCYWAVRDLGIGMAQIARTIGGTSPQAHPLIRPATRNERCTAR